MHCGIGFSGLLGRPVSEYGRLCHGAGPHGRGERCRRMLMLSTHIESRRYVPHAPYPHRVIRVAGGGSRDLHELLQGPRVNQL